VDNNSSNDDNDNDDNDNNNKFAGLVESLLS
jgi:hypothetical protein